VGLRDRIKPRFLDWTMGFMDDLRPETVSEADGNVLEVGFGTGLNLQFYGAGVRSVTGLDPMTTEGIRNVEDRISAAAFPVRRAALRADGELPFDAGQFDCVITTWTLCSIPEPLAALAEMRRVLKPGGRYVFIEHGRSERPRAARWQERLNPFWCRFSDGCNMDRKIDQLVETGGFELTSLKRFSGRGPELLASMYRGIATRI
jgi:ubiquinone/menaquinone biosynthesis C-methylase UbiE